MSATNAGSSSSNKKPAAAASVTSAAAGSPARVGLRQLRFGWWALLTYLSLGIALEVLHGLKIGWYLDAGNEARRLMFTLAHAHGTLLALINIAAGLTARGVAGFALARSASASLLWSAVVLPAGFFLGGLVTYGGDPGLGVLLVPVGAVMLLYGVARTARDLSNARNT